MARLDIYIPDELAAKIKMYTLNKSLICRQALIKAVKQKEQEQDEAVRQAFEED